MTKHMLAASSFWEKNAFLRQRDLIIVGGGIVGMTAALAFKRSFSNRSVLILDRHPIPLGASTRNAGFACLGSPTEVLSNISSAGIDQARRVLSLRRSGLRRLLDLVPQQIMDYVHTGGYEVFRAEDHHAYQQCVSNLPMLNALYERGGHLPLYQDLSTQVPPGLKNFKYCIAAPHEGMLHPGKMIAHLQRRCVEAGIDILHFGLKDYQEHASGVDLTLDSVELTCAHLLLATNGFTHALTDQAEVVPARNVVLVSTATQSQLKGTFHYHQGYYYFRNIGSRILVGGARHLHRERESSDQFLLPPDLLAHLETFANQHFVLQRPFEVEHRWSGIMGIGPSLCPEVKKLGPRIHAAVGLGGMGIAIGSELGHQAASKIGELI
ncbi:MAG: FAD-binding oxidoreductase [Saprospiraceae bacterium]|nr:FAD-binding oxidoreductase [Saprospiraceae bacterium]